MHKLIDRIDTFCLTHAWVPSWVRVRVGRLWERTMRHKSAGSRIRSAEKLGLTGDGE